MTPKDPFLEGTFWDKFWRPIRSRALLSTPESFRKYQGKPLKHQRLSSPCEPLKILTNKQKTFRKTKEFPSKKNTKEAKTPKKRRTRFFRFPRFLPICFDVALLVFGNTPIYSDLLRFLLICSDLFQNKAGNPFLPTPSAITDKMRLDTLGLALAHEIIVGISQGYASTILQGLGIITSRQISGKWRQRGTISVKNLRSKHPRCAASHAPTSIALGMIGPLCSYYQPKTDRPVELNLNGTFRSQIYMDNKLPPKDAPHFELMPTSPDSYVHHWPEDSLQDLPRDRA